MVGGALRQPSEAHPGLTTGASAWSRGWGMRCSEDSRSCPQLPAGSPQPHTSSLAAWPDPSPPPLSSSGSCLSLLRFLPLSSSPLLRSLFLLPPYTQPSLLRLVPGPLRCCTWASTPSLHLALLWSPLSVSHSDQILGVTGLLPLWLLRGARVAVGRALPPPASLSLTPSLPPCLAGGPAPLPPHLSNHRAPHLASC